MDTALAPTPAGYARLHRTVVRIKALRAALGTDLPTSGAIVRAVDSSGRNVEAGCRALEPLYDQLGATTRALLVQTVGDALRAADAAAADAAPA